MNNLKEIIFTKQGDEYQAIGIYVKRGETHYQGEDDDDPVSTVLESGSSYYAVRREGMNLAYANRVPFCDFVSVSFGETLAKMVKKEK